VDRVSGYPYHQPSSSRFHGPRINCESVPRLPAYAVAWALADPRKTPYVLQWNVGGRFVVGVPELAESVRISRALADEHVILTRVSGSTGLVRVVRRTTVGAAIGSDLLLVCRTCGQPKRHLYAWERNGSRLATSGRWPCRKCAGLRFESEGHRRPVEMRGLWQPYPRDPWEPLVFSSQKRAAEALSV
jgi:hypothetical protein